MRKVIGIDRKIKRAWLDAVLDQLVQTTDEAQLRTFLDDLLSEELPSKQSRAKSIGIILRIWSGIPPERVALRDRAVTLLPGITGQERVWVHWGMTALAYPFFRDTIEVVGRLLALQDDFTTAQVQARIVTSWGDRVTSKEAVQKLLTTLVDWEVLESKKKGQFLLADKMAASNPELQLWLLEGLLRASESEEIEAQQLLRLPETFPFKISVGVSDLRKHDGFNIHRQGLDMDMVASRKVKVEPPPKPTRKRKPTKKAKPEQPSLFDQPTVGVASRNGKAVSGPTIPATRLLDNVQPDNVDVRSWVEESIRKEVLQTLPERAERFLQVRRVILTNQPFAAPTAECVRLFRDGHYFGCMALAQSVMESVIHHVWQTKLKKRASQKGSFEKNLEALHKKKLISDEWKTKLDQMWSERHALHQQRPSITADLQALKVTARKMLKLLSDLEEEFFGFKLHEDTVIPDHPEFWTERVPSPG